MFKTFKKKQTNEKKKSEIKFK